MLIQLFCESFRRTTKLLMAIWMVFLASPPAWAQEGGLLGDIRPPNQAADYLYRSSPKESMISVQLLGAVNRPGIYTVPANTDLLKLLSLAGGSSDSGDMTEILVRKTENQGWNKIKSKAIDEYSGAYEVDLEKIIKYGGGRQLTLAQDDFIYVPAKEAWISNNVSRSVTVVSLLLGIALTSVLIQKNSN